MLDRGDVRVRDDDGLGEFGFDEDSVQRAFVGVQSENGERGVGLRRINFEHEDGAVRVESELLDATVGEDGAVPVGESEVEPGPLAVPEGESKVPGVGIEVEGLVVGIQERRSDVRDVGPSSLPKATSVAGVEGKGGLHCGSGMGPVDSEFSGEALGELRQRALSSEALLERLADAPIDHESEVGEEGEDGRGKGLGEVADEAPTDGHVRKEGGRRSSELTDR
jgi:hypothetical protein